MSVIDRSETVLERPRLSFADLGWQAPPFAVPGSPPAACPAPPPAACPAHTAAACPDHPPAACPAAPPDARQRIAKRILDLALATVALVLSLPLLLAVAGAIRLDSPGPVLFRQRRIGLRGRSFVLLKFRTMHHHPPDRGRLPQACPHDRRVTRIGALLRHWSIDELPQLWNVLRGEMSLVGPRPHAPGTCAGDTPFEQVSARYGLRHVVPPGLTGLAQVRDLRGPTETEAKLLLRLDSDLEYIAAWSLWLDCRILARTMATVLLGRNAC